MSIVKQISDALGVDIVETVKDLVDEYIHTDEEKAIERLKKEELLMKYQLQSRIQDVKEFETEARDRDSARRLQMEMIKSKDTFNSKFVSALTILLIIGSFVFMFAFMTEPNINKDIGMLILGILSTVLTSVLSFWFGSSLGSKQKSVQLNKMLT